MNRRNFGSFPESPTKESKKMRKHQNCCDYCDYYEYHGNTEIERIRIRAGETINRDWLNFDSVAGAMEYFNTECGEFIDDPGRGSETLFGNGYELR